MCPVSTGGGTSCVQLVRGEGGGLRAWNAGDGSPCSMRAAASAVTLHSARARRERRRRARGGGGGLLRLQPFRSWSLNADFSLQQGGR